MKLQRSRRDEPDVNITSLIDVVFLLLIFFMVSTTFDRTSQVSIQLPTASGKVQPDEKSHLDITIDARGRYFVNGEEVINTRIETLKRAIARAVGDGKESQVILSADHLTPMQSVVTAMDAARQLGLVHLTFATTQPAGAD